MKVSISLQLLPILWCPPETVHNQHRMGEEQQLRIPVTEFQVKFYCRFWVGFCNIVNSSIMCIRSDQTVSVFDRHGEKKVEVPLPG